MIHPLDLPALDIPNELQPLTWRYGGAGILLERGRQIIWETSTMADMLHYCRQRGLRPEFAPIRLVRFA